MLKTYAATYAGAYEVTDRLGLIKKKKEKEKEVKKPWWYARNICFRYVVEAQNTSRE